MSVSQPGDPAKVTVNLPDKIEAHWDQEVENGGIYTRPCLDLTRSGVESTARGPEEVPPGFPVFPRSLLQDVRGRDVLCLASGGGQQSAVFGLLGARVTVLDLSAGQLRGDSAAAERHGYPVRLVKGDMRDLSVFAAGAFDLVYQPVSICFVPDVREVYREAYRVLRPGGVYAVGHCNPATLPVFFTGGGNGWDGAGYRIAEPYAGGPIRMTAGGVENMREGEPTGEYRHLLRDIFGGLLEAGFVIAGVAEDPRHLQGNPADEPGSDAHCLAHIAEYFKVVCRRPYLTGTMEYDAVPTCPARAPALRTSTNRRSEVARETRMTFDPDQKRALYEQISAMPTVDAHEHLHPEAKRLERKVDIFLLFHQYLCVDLMGAGMSEQAAHDLGEEEVPLDQKWDSIAPYLDLVTTGSVAGPPLAALRKFFDAEMLTKENYVALTEKMRAHNQPGLYERILREACNIDVVLNQNMTMWQTPLFRPILFESFFIGSGTRDSLAAVLEPEGLDLPADLDGYVQAMEALLARRAREGMVGVKGYAMAYVPGSAEEARPAYARLLAGRPDEGDGPAVLRTLRGRMWDCCGRLGLTVALHSGIWAGNWASIESIRPTHVTEIACAHRGTRFDLFHAASPQPVDAGFLGRSLPNVYLNSCWSHLLSPRLILDAWDMWLDMMPINRVIAWGGDYWWAVENTWGALDKVRQVLAELLARRIARGDFNEARALQIARRWMHDNACEVYSLC